MKNIIIITIITTVVIGAIGTYTMLDVKYLLDWHAEEVIRRPARRRKEWYKLKY